MSWIYNIALHFLALLAGPSFVYALLKKGKYRKSFFNRFGKGFPRIEKNGKELIWIHAVSLGETRAIAPLIARLKKQNVSILLTTATETGFAEGKKIEADYHAYMPLDFSYIINPIVKRVKPALVVLTETDFWYNFQKSAKKNGATLLLLNGKMSERSCNRLKRVPFFAKALFGTIDRFCVQGPLYAKRFSSLGIPNEKIEITGNIKLDGFTKEDSLDIWREKLGINRDDLVLTCGSTHDPEEKIILQKCKTLLAKWPHLKIILVPRHPERFDKVAALLNEAKLSYGRFSKSDSLSNKKILLMDAMGNLRKCYGLSTMAFVGGSLTNRVGGHNILEPSFYGVPVLYGPFMYTQPDLLDLMVSYEAGEEVTEKNFEERLEKYLSDENLRKKRGLSGLKMVEENGGALEKSMREILFLLEKRET